MEKVRPWCGQPSDRGRLKNRNRNRLLMFLSLLFLITPCELGDIVSLTGKDGSILHLDTAPACQLSLALRDERFCYCSAISTCGRWLAYSDQKSSRLFQLNQVESVDLVTSYIRLVSSLQM